MSVLPLSETAYEPAWSRMKSCTPCKALFACSPDNLSERCVKERQCQTLPDFASPQLCSAGAVPALVSTVVAALE